MGTDSGEGKIVWSSVVVVVIVVIVVLVMVVCLCGVPGRRSEDMV